MNQVKVLAQQLTRRYGGVLAVDRVDVTVHAGECVGLLGPNGAGKTTTMEMMEGLRRPDSGTCQICGYDVLSQAPAVRRCIGLSLQRASMPAHVTVRELLSLYASFYPNPVPVPELLDRFQLTEKARSLCTTLSGGQKQRLALALALVGRPEVVFLDEPTTGLDPRARQNLWQAILQLKAEGHAIVLSTHYMEEAERLCDRVLIMDRGRVVAAGRPRDLIEEHCPQGAVELRVRLDHSPLDALAKLPGVTRLKTEGDDRVALITSAVSTTLQALAHLAQQEGLSLADLHVRSSTLEDVFIALTGRGLRTE